MIDLDAISEAQKVIDRWEREKLQSDDLRDFRMLSKSELIKMVAWQRRIIAERDQMIEALKSKPKCSVRF